MSAPDETLLDHLRQQALTTHQRCEKLLAGKQPLSSKDIHALRVASKRLRADWQVLKPLLKDNLAEEANRTLRDAAASLRQARDLKVMAETLQKLAEQARGKDTRRALGDGYQQLFAELPDTAVVAKKSASLRAAFEQDQQRWQALELKIPDRRLRQRGVGRLYEKAFKLARAAEKSGDVKHWHRNRKWVKYLGYSHFLLNTETRALLSHQLVTALGKMLGELHDIHCLIEYVKEQKDTFANEDAAAYLIHHLRVAEGRLQARCEKQAQKLFLLSPRKFEEALKSSS